MVGAQSVHIPGAMKVDRGRAASGVSHVCCPTTERPGNHARAFLQLPSHTSGLRLVQNLTELVVEPGDEAPLNKAVHKSPEETNECAGIAY